MFSKIAAAYRRWRKKRQAAIEKFDREFTDWNWS